MSQPGKTELKKLAVHRIGNKSLEEGFSLSDKTIELVPSEELYLKLMDFFLQPLKDSVVHHFSHPVEPGMNEVYTIVSGLFDEPKQLLKRSGDLCKLLYELSGHPRIKSGEFYTAYFTGCEYEGQVMDAIGLFKSENKESFLKVEHRNADVNLELLNGINMKKLDKGCLVLNTQQKNGYVVYCVDTASGSNDAQYWKDMFLGLKLANDQYNNTTNILKLTKEFVAEMAAGDSEITRTRQAEWLSKSMDYFNEKANFNIKEFEKTVFDEPDLIKSFQSFGSSYVTQRDIDIADSFPISDAAVKKQSKVFKSVLKLDKNFHIYIHGNPELIERGYDAEKGKRYYKVYYDEEK
jgi:hypothetical protein